MIHSLRRRRRLRSRAACASMLALVGASCAGNDGEAGRSDRPAGDAGEVVAKIDSKMYDSPEWVDTYRPESAFAGYTLVLYQRRVPMLIDMDGRVVRAWHGVRAMGRARLLPTGHLATIAASGRLEEYDWDRQLAWSFQLPDSDTFLHHDFIQLANENYLLLAHDPTLGADFLLEVDRSGQIVWRWDAAEHLAEDFVPDGKAANKTHVNSVFELPPNRWFDDGQQRFRPGNILISARNLNTLYIIARPQGDVVWRFDGGLDYQHEAMMIPPGTRGAGNILLFNNGYHNLDGYRQSAILEINPITGERVWEYRQRGFFSSTGGTQQSLGNGNVLVTSSQGGRVFELTRQGRIVWQWSPPFMPMRASRYARDHAPQLEALPEPADEPIERWDPDSFIDRDLYTFSLPHQTRRVRQSGGSKYLLKDTDRCQELRIPVGAELQLGLGTWFKRQDPTRPFVSDVLPARFTATAQIVGGDEVDTLYERVLEPKLSEMKGDPSALRLTRDRVSLAGYAQQTIELCLEISSLAGDQSPDGYVWEEPLVFGSGGPPIDSPDTPLDEEALAAQEKHLKAIGYIN